jgi:hypothetical protein
VTTNTSLFPKNGVYLVPLKDILRKPDGISVGHQITLSLQIRG